MTRNRWIANLAVVGLTVSLTFAASLLQPVAPSDATSASSGRWNANLDAATSAIPTPAQPSVIDQNANLLRVRQSNAKVTASAAATANCDGCQGQATTLQVVYFDGRGPKNADNVATAWSECTGCSSKAVSVQVVIAKQIDQLVVNNRSLALNVGCDGCTTGATAMQFVLVGGSRRDLSAAAKKTVGELQATLADQLAAAPSDPNQLATARAQSDTTSVADQLQEVLVADTGSTAVQRNIDIQIAP